ALAAANQLYAHYPTIVATLVYDPSSAGDTAARQTAADNGFPENLTDTTIVVHIPPRSGPFTGKLGFAEVIITYNQPRYFSSVWGSSATPSPARAVAKAFYGAWGDGVICLDPTAKQSLNATGGASLIVTGGANVVVDSNNYDAADVSGGGGATATAFNVTGG